MDHLAHNAILVECQIQEQVSGLLARDSPLNFHSVTSPFPYTERAIEQPGLDGKDPVGMSAQVNTFHRRKGGMGQEGDAHNPSLNCNSKKKM